MNFSKFCGLFILAGLPLFVSIEKVEANAIIAAVRPFAARTGLVILNDEITDQFGDLVLSPGESGALRFDIRNTLSMSVDTVSIQLISLSPDMQMNGYSFYGQLQAGEQRSVDTTYYQIFVNPGVANGTELPFDLIVNFSLNGVAKTFTVHKTLTVYVPGSLDYPERLVTLLNYDLHEAFGADEVINPGEPVASSFTLKNLEELPLSNVSVTAFSLDPRLQGFGSQWVGNLSAGQESQVDFSTMNLTVDPSTPDQTILEYNIIVQSVLNGVSRAKEFHKNFIVYTANSPSYPSSLVSLENYNASDWGDGVLRAGDFLHFTADLKNIDSDPISNASIFIYSESPYFNQLSGSNIWVGNILPGQQKVIDFSYVNASIDPATPVGSILAFQLMVGMTINGQPRFKIFNKEIYVNAPGAPSTFAVTNLVVDSQFPYLTFDIQNTSDHAVSNVSAAVYSTDSNANIFGSVVIGNLSVGQTVHENPNYLQITAVAGTPSGTVIPYVLSITFLEDGHAGGFELPQQFVVP